MKKRVLICGATGFIGRNLAERLAAREDLEVVGVAHAREPFEHPGLEWVRADLAREDDVARVLEGVDVVVQAAATTSGVKDALERPWYHVTDNAVMNSLIFRAAHLAGVQHVVFFSCTVMYPQLDRALREEDFDANAGIHDRYFGVGWTKVYLEKMAEFFARQGRTRFTVLRHSNVYGPHDKFDLERSHVFGATVAKVMQADEAVTVWGAGEEGRDLLYVDDLVDCVETAIRRQDTAHELLNVGAGEATTINDLVRRIISASGKSLRMDHDLSRPSIPTRVWLDCSRARAVLGWEPRVGLEEGIRRTLEWYRQHQEVVRRQA